MGVAPPGEFEVWPGKERIQPAADSEARYYLSYETLNTKSFKPSVLPKYGNLGSLIGSKAKFLNNTPTLKKQKHSGESGVLFLFFCFLFFNFL